MGQGWTKFKFGSAEACNNPARPDVGVSPSLTLEQSQATTEGSSSVPMYQGGLYAVSAAEVEIDAKVVAFLERLQKFRTCITKNLSSLHDQESEEAQERGKETRNSTPTPSTSQLDSPLQAFLKAPEKAQHLKREMQASPSAPPQARGGKCSTLKLCDSKTRAGKRPLRGGPSPPSLISRLPSRLVQAGGSANLLETTEQQQQQQQPAAAARKPPPAAPTPSTSLFAPSQAPDDDELQQLDDDTPSPSPAPEAPNDHEMRMHRAHDDGDDDDDEDVKEGGGVLPSSSQTVLLFELDRKRKAPAGLPSLAVPGANPPRASKQLKARTPLDIPSGGGSREAVLDLGMGDALVGRCVKKAVGNRGFTEGRVSFYNAALRSYQIKYNNGKDEMMEWIDLEPCLVEQSKKTVSAPLADHGDKGAHNLRQSLQNRPRFKKVEELVYTKRKGRGRRRKK